MKQLIIDSAKAYFSSNEVKSVIEMNGIEYHAMQCEIAKICAEAVQQMMLTEISAMTISDFNSIQQSVSNAAICNDSSCTNDVSKEPNVVHVKRKSGRPASAKKLGLYANRKDLPKTANQNLICKVYGRKDGKCINEMYAVLDSDMDITKAKNTVKSKYAKFKNTHYMNVSVSMLSTNRKPRSMRVASKNFGEYYSAK